MPIEFSCPGCQRRLRVPDGTEGRLAQCPVCGLQTPIPAPGGTGASPMGHWGEPTNPTAGGYPGWPGQEIAPSEVFRTESFSPPTAELSEAAPAASFGHPVWGDDRTRQYAYSQISGPANWLAAMSAIAFGLGLVGLFLVVLGMAAEGHRAGPQGMEAIESERTTALTMIAGGLLVNLLVLFGSIKMKQLQNYPLAMTAALLAVIPCTSPCCVLSMPFGLWALVALTDPAVKAAFR